MNLDLERVTYQDAKCLVIWHLMFARRNGEVLNRRQLTELTGLTHAMVMVVIKDLIRHRDIAMVTGQKYTWLRKVTFIELINTRFII